MLAMPKLDKLPEKRHARLYVYVKPTNKKFIEDVAGEMDLPASVLMDSILDSYRDSYYKKPKRRSRKTS